MILRISFLILLGCSVAFAHTEPADKKTCLSGKQDCHREKSSAVTPEDSAEVITNSPTLTRLDEEGFTVRLDCSQFAEARIKDAKAFLLDLTIPEECQQNSPAYGQRVLILVNPISMEIPKAVTDEK